MRHERPHHRLELDNPYLGNYLPSSDRRAGRLRQPIAAVAQLFRRRLNPSGTFVADIAITVESSRRRCARHIRERRWSNTPQRRLIWTEGRLVARIEAYRASSSSAGTSPY
jgi:hypothetical protein